MFKDMFRLAWLSSPYLQVRGGKILTPMPDDLLNLSAFFVRGDGSYRKPYHYYSLSVSAYYIVFDLWHRYRPDDRDPRNRVYIKVDDSWRFTLDPDGVIYNGKLFPFVPPEARMVSELGNCLRATRRISP